MLLCSLDLTRFSYMLNNYEKRKLKNTYYGLMQTFLPYASFSETFKCLDNKRLGKQRVEAFQIYKCLMDIPTKSGKLYSGWKNHPAVLMWKGYENALLDYYNLCVKEWISRGFNNSMPYIEHGTVILPEWIGNERFHSGHRSNLLRKNYAFYSKFNWSEPDNLPYFWPV